MTVPGCVHLKPAPEPGLLTLPGGVTLEHINLVDIVQPALTPLVPLFNIIDAVLAVFKGVEAIPKAIGLPPDPTALLEAIPELAKKVAVLLRIVPQLSLPLTVVGLLDLVIDVLRTAKTQLIHLQQQSRQLQGVVRRGTELDDEALLEIAACAQKNIEQEAANAIAGLASIGSLVALLNLFLSMLGQSPAPSPASLSGRSLDDAIAPIDSLADKLMAVRAAIPLP